VEYQRRPEVAVNHPSELKDRLCDFTSLAHKVIIVLVQVDNRAALLIDEYLEEYSSNSLSINPDLLLSCK